MTLENRVKVRSVRAGDAARVGGALRATRVSHARKGNGQAKGVLEDRDGAGFVAETKEHGVVGWIHVSTTPLIEVERRAEVNGLVVDETVGSQGAGWLLLDAGEK